MVGVTVAAFFFGGGGLFAFLLNLSLFFAFATLYPDVQIYVFFVLPLKVKWLAFVSLAPLLLELLWGSLSTKAAILVSFLNYFVFFGPSAYAKLRDATATDIRKRKFESKAIPGRDPSPMRRLQANRKKIVPSLNSAFHATARNIVSIICRSEELQEFRSCRMGDGFPACGWRFLPPVTPEF